MRLRRTRVGAMLALVGLLAVTTLLPGCPTTPNGGGNNGDRGLRGTITEIRRGPQQDLVAVYWPGETPATGDVCFSPQMAPIQPTDNHLPIPAAPPAGGLCSWASQMPPGAMYGQYEGEPGNCMNPMPCE